MAQFQIIKPFYKNQQLILVSIYGCKVGPFYDINQLNSEHFRVNFTLTTHKFLLQYQSYHLNHLLYLLQQLTSMSPKPRSLLFQNKFNSKYAMLCKPLKYLLKYYHF